MKYYLTLISILLFHRYLNFTLASTAAADDLTIAVTGATNSSLVLASSGTGADAVQLTASAGGMDITSATAMDITTSANNAWLSRTLRAGRRRMRWNVMMDPRVRFLIFVRTAHAWGPPRIAPIITCAPRIVAMPIQAA